MCRTEIKVDVDAEIVSSTADSDEQLLEWSDLRLTLHVGGRSLLRRRSPVPKQVLCGVSGSLEPRSMLAIMGPSGSGKSSLLSVLAGRSPDTPHSLAGEITVGGAKVSKQQRRSWGFVFQDDLLLSNLSVRETVHFSALLRLPEALSHEVRAERVTTTLQQLKLLECADTLIGSEARRGVSGGERKRTAIAVELVSRPRLLFLDEPTSGLDAATALLLVSLLSDLARGSSMQVLCSVHQPRSNIFSAFHRLLLLARGRAVYSGSLQAALPHFERAAGEPLPPLTNPADWLIDLIDAGTVGAPPDDAAMSAPAPAGATAVTSSSSIVASAAAAVTTSAAEPTAAVAATAWDRTLERATTTTTTTTPTTPTPTTPTPTRRWQTSSLWQFRVLLSRSTRQQRGDVFNVVNVFQIVSVAVVVSAVWAGHELAKDRIGVLFFVNIQQAFNTQSAVLRLFPAERALFRRERRGGAYRVLPYFLAKSLADGVAIFVLPVFYSSLIYWAVGLRRDAEAFFSYLALALALVTVAHSYGLLMSIAFRTIALANSVAFVIILLLLIFGGFYISLDQIAPWCRWIKYGSYLYWGFSGMLANEFGGGRELSCSAQRAGEYAPACPFSGDLVLQSMGMGDASVGLSILVLCALALLFRLAAYVCLRFELAIG